MLLEHERNYGLGMDALVAVCSWNTNGIMVWAWMIRSSIACEHERNHGLGMDAARNYGLGFGCSGNGIIVWGLDALVAVCSWNTNGIMVWAWMLWSSTALETRTELWFGHGCSGGRMLLEHERNYGLGMDALVAVCSWNTNGIMVWAWMIRSSIACEHERNHGLGMDAARNYGLGFGCSGNGIIVWGLDALVAVCSSNTNGIMVWAWMLWSSYALETRTESWFGHGCSGHRVLLKHERNSGLGMDALVAVCSLLEHERNHGLGMDALVIVCSWNTNGIMVWAWMLWSSYALGTRTESWFGHGCSGHRMLLEHERNYGLGMDALVTECS